MKRKKILFFQAIFDIDDALIMSNDLVAELADVDDRVVTHDIVPEWSEEEGFYAILRLFYEEK